MKKYYNNKLICLKRAGSIHFPIFNIILKVHLKNSKIFIEKIGQFNPNFSDRKFFIILIDWFIGCNEMLV